MGPCPHVSVCPKHDFPHSSKHALHDTNTNLKRVVESTAPSQAGNPLGPTDVERSWASWRAAPRPPTMADDEEEVSTDTVSFLIVAGSLVQASKAIRDAITENGFQVRSWVTLSETWHRTTRSARKYCRAGGNQAPSRAPPSLFLHMLYLAPGLAAGWRCPCPRSPPAAYQVVPVTDLPQQCHAHVSPWRGI